MRGDVDRSWVSRQVRVSWASRQVKESWASQQVRESWVSRQVRESVHPEASAAVLAAVVAAVVKGLMHHVASVGVAGIGTVTTTRVEGN